MEHGGARVLGGWDIGWPEVAGDERARARHTGNGDRAALLGSGERVETSAEAEKLRLL